MRQVQEFVTVKKIKYFYERDKERWNAFITFSLFKLHWAPIVFYIVISTSSGPVDRLGLTLVITYDNCYNQCVK